MIEDHVERFDSVQPAFALCECWGEKIRAMRVPAQDDFHGLEEEQRLLRIRARRLLTIPLAVLFVALLVTIPQFARPKGPAHPIVIGFMLLIPISIAAFGITYLAARRRLEHAKSIGKVLKDEFVLAFGEPDKDCYPVLVGWPSWFVLKDALRLTPARKWQPYTWLQQPLPPVIREALAESAASVNSMPVAPRMRPMSDLERREVEWMIRIMPFWSEHELASAWTLVSGYVLFLILSPHRSQGLWPWLVALVFVLAVAHTMRIPAKRWFWRGLLKADLASATVCVQEDEHGHILEYLPISEFSMAINGYRTPIDGQLFFPREPSAQPSAASPDKGS